MSKPPPPPPSRDNDRSVHRPGSMESRLSSTSSRPTTPSSRAMTPGAQFGRYKIVQVLGRGGMGTVYAANDAQLGRIIALKVPHFDASDGGKTLERFYREARAAAKLNHPNLCPVHDFGEIDGVHYLTMAFVRGAPLSQHRGRRMEQPKAAALVRILAMALAEAHDAGVTHRDLKPSNIMLDPSGRPVVMDFGLALHTTNNEASRITQSGVMVGTPAYMPPEQVRGEVDRQGPCCDVYSLGVILYELLAGRLPFEGPPVSVLAMILTTEPAPPSTYRPDLDSRLEAACLTAMAKEPSKRFACMREFAAALADYLKSPQPVRARRRSPAPSPAYFEPIADTVADDDAALRKEDPRPKRGRRKKKARDASSTVDPKLVVGIVGGLLLLMLLPFLALSTRKEPEANVQQQGPINPEPNLLPNWLPQSEAKRQRSTNNLKQVGIALASHRDAYRSLPVNGVSPERPTEMPHSWMTRLLPFLLRQDVYNRIDFQASWTDPKNQEAFQTTVPQFLLPDVQPTQSREGYALAHYAGNIRLFGIDARSRDDIRDGAANTIAAGEAAGNYMPWGNQSNLRELTEGINRLPTGFGNPRGDGAYFLFADGVVRFIHNDIDPQLLRAASTPSGGEPFTAEQLR